MMPGPPPLFQAAVAAASLGGVGAGVGSGGIGPTTTPNPMPPPPITPPTYLLPPPYPGSSEALLHYSFPSEADTLAYVDALKHSDLSDWRSLQEVAARAGAGSCSGAVTTSVLTALYLLGLFNLCAASPASCCVPPPSSRRRRRRTVDATLPPLLNNLQHNLSSLSLEQFHNLPHVTTPDGGRIPLHISVVEQVRKLWDSNPRLLSSVSCSSPTESVRSSFISLSGVASGIILAYSIAQLTQCYPDHRSPGDHFPPKIWFFPIPKVIPPPHFPVMTIPTELPVRGEDEEEDGCERDEVPLGFDRCAPLLSSDYCAYRHWVLLNNETRMGECVPRLCADNFVYVEADQMCHDVDEPGICPGNRRLYVTADGNAVCDCPEGMFPGLYDRCYFLYEQAYCQKGSVLQFDKETKSLTCKRDPCGYVNNNLWPDDLPYAPRGDGYCYQFNEQGPCKRSERFGFDTEKLAAVCVSLEEAGLIRPRRSYMYQQMSFPATQDHQYPHYQVSYIIMNGTSWDLEVKGIRRTKRDVSMPIKASPHYLQPGHMVVPFIDTREIPQDLLPMMKPRPPRWVTHRRNRRGNNHTKLHHNHGTNNRHREHAHRHERKRMEQHGHALQVNARPGTEESRMVTTPRGSNEGNHEDDNDERKKSSRKKSRSRRMRARDHASGRQNLEEETRRATARDHSRSDSERPRQRSHKSPVIKVDQGGLVTTVVHRTINTTTIQPQESTTHGHIRKKQHQRNRNSKGGRSKKGRRRSRGRGRGRGRGRDRGRGGRDRSKGRSQRRRNKEDKSPSSNSTKTEKKRRRKNPKLPFRVPTVIPPSNNETAVTGNVEEPQTGRVGIEDERADTGTTNVDEDRSVKNERQEIHSDTESDIEDGLDEEGEQSSSSETSLPKYLRHRGRRQLGEGGGIIKAPLLSACKPGAKRDYNYKCRPKFIPQERDRREVYDSAKPSGSTPRTPRISCPQGTRLDPRGKCQRVS